MLNYWKIINQAFENKIEKKQTKNPNKKNNSFLPATNPLLPPQDQDTFLIWVNSLHGNLL